MQYTYKCKQNFYTTNYGAVGKKISLALQRLPILVLSHGIANQLLHINKSIVINIILQFVITTPTSIKLDVCLCATFTNIFY